MFSSSLLLIAACSFKHAFANKTENCDIATVSTQKCLYHWWRGSSVLLLYSLSNLTDIRAVVDSFYSLNLMKFPMHFFTHELLNIFEGLAQCVHYMDASIICKLG